MTNRCKTKGKALFNQRDLIRLAKMPASSEHQVRETQAMMERSRPTEALEDDKREDLSMKICGDMTRVRRYLIGGIS